jgi:hypothetical protein
MDFGEPRSRRRESEQVKKGRHNCEDRHKHESENNEIPTPYRGEPEGLELRVMADSTSPPEQSEQHTRTDPSASRSACPEWTRRQTRANSGFGGTPYFSSYAQRYRW